MALHDRVERQHFLKHTTTNALVNSVNQVLNNFELDVCLVKSFTKLRVVFCNILQGGGGNGMVAENRGVQNNKVKIEKVLRKIEKVESQKNTVNLHNYDGFDDEEEGINHIPFECEYV